ncbi:SNF2-related protein [Legionella jordanis]|uniref:SNF2/RAD54 family transporter domain-containing protein n=1 Tax=Legionella jordanis TaxID=456 RepID=A0A0W0VFI5_9GAMM|nr:SNF2-related protein [Legionella jordanis]KTD18863.1 SNF2/RAD54 family transporter domain-containing protein [Legionella jordanis]RMX05566.1 ATP-dependent helicase [Legionella jordanis]VEH12963.1 DNA helicase, SNF2/RAD54 family domain protein [Legionella jordanis]
MIFGFNIKKRSKQTLIYDEQFINNQWVLLFKLQQKNSLIPLSEWHKCDHKGAQWLLEFIEANNLQQQPSVDTLIISSKDFITSIKEQELFIQNLLELPPLFDGGIHIISEGLIAKNNYKIKYHWVNSYSRPIIQSKEWGIFLQIGENKFLLPWYAWKIKEEIKLLQTQLVSSSSIQKRLELIEHFSSIRHLLPEEKTWTLTDDGSISKITLFFANAFKIQAVPEKDSFRIEPILLRKKELENLDPHFENILPPIDQEAFIRSFNNSLQLNQYYGLGPGRYLLIHPQVNKALETVHKIQHATKEEKLEFLKNPKAALAEDLEGIINEDELDQIFSDRVIGIGDWNAKIIPWIQLPPNEWLPGGELPNVPFGIDINGDKHQFANKNEVSDLVDKLKNAQKDGYQFYQYGEFSIPVNNENISKLECFLPKKPNTVIEKEDKLKTLTGITDKINQTPVMLVKENLECVEFNVFRHPRVIIPHSNAIPNNVKSEPKPHQIEAFKWLQNHYIAGSRGVLLADDMGLGKTFQSLMFLAWLHEAMKLKEITNKPLLIVAPTGLLKNWEDEINIHLSSGLGNLLRAYGSTLKNLKSGRYLDVTQLKGSDLILTTFDTLTRYQTSFSVINFAVVVFDEIQKLKNPGTQNYSAACSLHCDFWLGMTGTPVENRLCDLWAITDVLQPGMLGSIKEFSTKYEKSILTLGENEQNEIIKELQDGLTKASEKAPPFMLRRMKSSILPGLPKKNIHVKTVLMPNIQANAYQKIIQEVAQQEESGGMLKALHLLRACSLHPDSKRQRQYNSYDEFILQSARVKECFQILDSIYKNKEKALIFIEYNEWHHPAFLPHIIKTRYNLKKLPMAINGQINSKSRQDIVDKFQNERGIFDVMLLSPRAGGVGLTLTAANHIIHLTRWWNPAVEDQANDRIYRIGQNSDVHIYYILALHPEYESTCFDLNLHELLEKKRRLSQQIIIAPPMENDTIDELYAKTFQKNQKIKLPIEESYIHLNGKTYEDLIFQDMKKIAPKFGYIARYTQQSHDKGADIIIDTYDGETKAIVQCKFVDNPTKAPLNLTSDLDRASPYYSNSHSNPLLIGFTNAQKIKKADRTWENNANNRKIVYGKEGLDASNLFDFLD